MPGSADVTAADTSVAGPARHVVVVGAGITGLTAAFTLATRHPSVRVTVVEASDRVGGKILTTPFAGHQVDCGADAFLARVPEARELCEELGLGAVLTSPAERSALVWARGELRRLPAGLVLGVPTDLDALRASGIVSAEGVERAARDLDATTPPASEPEGDPAGPGDMSVGQLVRGRLGDEVHERLVSPLLSGVNAGDADHLSLAVGAAQLASAARRRPSLIEGAREQQRQARAALADPDAPVFHGIPVGTQTLTDLLLARLVAAGGRVHLRCPVDSLEHAADGSGGYVVGTPLGPLAADRVVLAVPGPVGARLLGQLAPDAAEGLAALDYASVAMVTLAVPRTAIGVPLDASGFLVGEADRLPTLTACSWASTKWAHLADPDVAILRVSAGRHGDTHALELDDDDLVAGVMADLGTTMGVTGEPTDRRVTRWHDALPQFRPGHLARAQGWRDEVAAVAPAWCWPAPPTTGSAFRRASVRVAGRRMRS
ncbi:MAG TPA: protoporphyrinogen oxidase, partial [Acidimicrobiales bacterium]